MSDFPSHSEQVADLIGDIIDTIVDDVASVKINRVATSNVTVIEVTVAKFDIGKVIGRKGGVATALRTLLCAISGKHNHRYQLEIIE